MPVSFRSAAVLNKVCATIAVMAIAACTPPPAPKPVPPPAPPVQQAHRTVAQHPLTSDQPGFIRLSNTPKDRVPVRVGVLLPFSNGSVATRNLAKAMMNAAQMAIFDARNRDILLMPADEGSNPQTAASAARTLIGQGAEVIVGPLFATSVSAVAPIARDRGIPVISFSTDRSVGGDGVYLLSFQPEAEVDRVITYAAAQGHKNFTALIPRTAYGDRVLKAFNADTAAKHLTVRAIFRFDPRAPDLGQTATSASASGADAVLIAQGGQPLAVMAAGFGTPHPQLLGTGLWADKALAREAILTGGWFAAPTPSADVSFENRYRSAYGAAPAQLAPLAYDAISLVAALASGTPYHRFTDAALTDANGFSGISGVFRLRADGSCDRGLAVLSMRPDGFHVVDPAPKTFQVPAS
ncbi:MAG: penicillin-binding protein activator [Alphaproteobacteria bacterium]|nr:penicillin-binding protein activator [Alphaproteobacteria bacterium]